MKIDTYLKAVVGAFASTFIAAGTAALDGNFELYEYFTTAGAWFTTFGAIYFTPNKP